MSDTRYEKTDLPFYREHIAPLLPPRVLDFHAHTWTARQRRIAPSGPGADYMVTDADYPPQRLAADLEMLFPDRASGAVCFGYPVPGTDLEMTNDALAALSGDENRFPLMITGRDTFAPDELARMLDVGGFYGYKVLLNWQGDDYGDVRIADMIGPAEMKLADERSLVVLLHVPRSGRLAEPVVAAGVRELAGEYPDARIVLAHCGRCYLPDEMATAVAAIADLDNVHMDTSMVMDPTVLQIAMENVGAGRLVFGTDLPVAAMRGRRVYVMDHWVDVVAEGYPPSAYRLASDDIRATFMAWEICLAVGRAGRRAGLADDELKAIFHDNGMRILDNVRRGGRGGSR